MRFRNKPAPVLFLGEEIGKAILTSKKLNIIVDKLGPKRTYQFKRSCVSGLFSGDCDKVRGQVVPVVPV
jgi:hypothetical protein